MPKDLNITITSSIVGSILAALGIMSNDVTLLIPAMIIAPFGFVLNEASKDIINYRLSHSLVNIILFIFMIMFAILVGFIFSKYNSEKLEEDRIKRFTNTNMKYHILIGLMLGSYTAYVTSVKDPGSIELLLWGVGIAISLLPPFVDVGIRMGQPSLDKSMIKSDYKIGMANCISFLVGAMGINYWMSTK